MRKRLEGEAPNRTGKHSFRALPTATAIIFGLILVWLSLAVAVDGVFAGRRPELVVRFWPLSSAARATLSTQLLAEKPTSPDLPRIRSLAEAALIREPVEAKAALALALSYAAENDERRSTRLHHYAENLSRRNVEAQLLLIEERVRQNDIRGALRHYDRALRVSSRARELLLPILVEASDYPEVASKLTPLVTVRPPWWIDFVDQLIPEGSPRAVAAVVGPLRLDSEDETERRRLVLALRRLTEAGAQGRAMAIYREARSSDRADALLRNGSFEEEPLVPPFEWWFASGADLLAAREPREGAEGQYALSLIRQGGATGEVANQLLQLPQGRYRLRAKIGAISGGTIDRPRIRLRCPNAEANFAELILPEAPMGGEEYTSEFSVPANCQGPWISIVTSSGVDGQSDTPWIDGLTISSF